MRWQKEFRSSGLAFLIVLLSCLALRACATKKEVHEQKKLSLDSFEKLNLLDDDTIYFDFITKPVLHHTPSPDARPSQAIAKTGTIVRHRAVSADKEQNVVAIDTTSRQVIKSHGKISHAEQDIKKISVLVFLFVLLLFVIASFKMIKE